MKFIFLSVLLALSLAQYAQASTIQQFDAEFIAKASELVFEGEVVSSHTEKAVNGEIYTYIDFSVLDVIRGEQPEQPILTLRFTGGRVGNLIYDAGVIIPTLGEHGIYFVETTKHHLNNPLLGWSQGHFKIDNQQRLIAGNNEVVTGVNNDKNEVVHISHGVARGVLTQPHSNSPDSTASSSIAYKSAPPVTVDFFKSFIKNIEH